MPARTVHVTAPSRLHFGLFTPSRSASRQYGGVGVMTERPGLCLRVTAGPRLKIRGPQRRRVAELVRRWTRWQGLSTEPACELQVLSAPRLHAGLGVGTQLALAVATALNAAFHRPAASPAALASSIGRGQRSAVGTHGFLQGGLIAEAGKLPGEALAPLRARLPLPTAWRFVLIESSAETGLHGREEARAFDALPAAAAETTRDLITEVDARMLPALRAEHFEAFAESVYRFGRLAGECFSSVQGGPYRGPLLENLVERLRRSGIRGVGQSSWGPTLFVLTESLEDAGRLVQSLKTWSELATAKLHISPPSNRGALVRVE